ncbi:alpha/beta fold hydrolase [Sphingopyxis fribergensis]
MKAPFSKKGNIEKTMIFGWNGETLHYSAEGAGTAVLLLHGLGGNAENWLLQRRHLAASHRVLSLDLPGHGRSSGRSVHFTDYWRAIEATLDHAGAPRAALCGLSKGARAGLAFAARCPERVTAMVVVNAFLRLDPDDRVRRLALYDLLLEENGAERWADQLLAMMGVEEYPAIVRGFRRSIGEIDPLHIRRIFREQDAFEQRPELQCVTCPALVVRGARDGFVPAYCADEIRAALVGSELAVLDAGHLPYLEVSTEFNRCLSQFLARNSI